MGYNKGKEEKKWKKWKEREEEELRELGIDEESIQLLHVYDQEAFNAERMFLTKQYVNSNLAESAVTTMVLPINTLDDVLSQLDNEELYIAMKQIDNKLTLEIIRLKIWDYSSKEIAQKLGMSVWSVNSYLRKVRKKIKK
ncbi:MAG: sigma-70 family RNA polymerase sigma factor [Erysipelotrichaceae bacterium]|nr:sigma-70 family RNA polymerase sigma factor [Erysipelotrichaceae bacterium]